MQFWWRTSSKVGKARLCGSATSKCLGANCDVAGTVALLWLGRGILMVGVGQMKGAFMLYLGKLHCTP